MTGAISNNLGIGLFTISFLKGAEYGRHTEILIEAEQMIYNDPNILSYNVNGITLFGGDESPNFGIDKNKLPEYSLRVNPLFLSTFGKWGRYLIHNFFQSQRKNNYQYIKEQRRKHIQELIDQRFMYPGFNNPYDGRNPWDTGQN